jgi:hypothetical protein
MAKNEKATKEELDRDFGGWTDDEEGWERVERFKFKREGEKWQGRYAGSDGTMEYENENGEVIQIKLHRIEISKGEYLDIMGDYKLDEFFRGLTPNQHLARVEFTGRTPIDGGKRQMNCYKLSSKRVK